MYKLDSNRDGRNIDQKNTLLSLFSKPGDRTSNAADQQALITQRRQVEGTKRETWLDKAKKKNAFRSTIGVIKPKPSRIAPVASLAGESTLGRTLDHSGLGGGHSGSIRMVGGSVHEADLSRRHWLNNTSSKNMMLRDPSFFDSFNLMAAPVKAGSIAV
jgi:hypothetical protein